MSDPTDSRQLPAPTEQPAQAVTPITEQMAALAEQVAIVGDLARLTPSERMAYYGAMCNSLGFNPMTRPFEYIQLNGKLTLYATKNATDQIRGIHGVSIEVVSQEVIGDVYVVRVRATNAAGRCEENIGAVAISGLRGEALANAYMKGFTKAGRRVSQAFAATGMLDETEVETIPSARRVQVDGQGNIRNQQQAPSQISRQADGPAEDLAKKMINLLSELDHVVLKEQLAAIKAAGREAGLGNHPAVQAAYRDLLEHCNRAGAARRINNALLKASDSQDLATCQSHLATAEDQLAKERQRMADAGYDAAQGVCPLWADGLAAVDRLAREQLALLSGGQADDVTDTQFEDSESAVDPFADEDLPAETAPATA